MDFRKIAFATLFAFVSSLSAFADILHNEQLAETARVMAQVFKDENVRAISLDDALSRKHFKLFLDSLDEEKLFFEESDIAALRFYETSLDDQMVKGDLSFVAKASVIYLARVRERLGVVKELVAENFDFTTSETLDTDYARHPFPADAAEARRRLRLEIKAQVLRQKLDYPDKSLDAIRAAVARRYEKMGKKIESMTDESWVEAFLECFARAFDPHSDYMAPVASDNFTAAISLQFAGVGIQFDPDDEEVPRVHSLSPGTPAAQDGTLRKGDRLVAVAPDGNPANLETVDEKSPSQVAHLIRGKAETKVLIRYAREGEMGTRDVVLTRAALKNESARARGEVKELTTTNGAKRRFGLIVLPTFYYDFNDCRENPTTCLSCVNDLRAILESDDFKGIDGLVLDLRNNTGGALIGAVDITGLFIETGPVTQVKGPFSLSTWRDRNPNVTYKGPMVIVVNGMSASASEILAAALQDSRRALVVGSDTFGKGTVQTFKSLVEVENRPRVRPEFEPLGSYKISTQEFFRINGDSTQGPGVIPNVKLPALGTVYLPRESEQPNALDHSRISPLFYRKYSLVPTDLEEKLVQSSAARVASSSEFTKLQAAIARARAAKGRKTIALNEAARREELRSEPVADESVRGEAVPLVAPKGPLSKRAASPDNFYNREILRITQEYVQGLGR